MTSRYLVGIDLGTTNSVVAYVDTKSGADTTLPISLLPIPQLVAHGEVQTLQALPSFLYFPTQEELSTGAVAATWDEDPPMVTGVLAREQGAFVPSRQVSSAKSWLSYPGVNRRAKILPSQAEPPQPMISPVEASARYLMHLRDAWNSALGQTDGCRLEQQEIVLTVPASFDEEARELTLEATKIAGLRNVTLIEEPLSAFYSWMRTGDDRQAERLILVCDIGGGTTDFSLIQRRSDAFERIAIGEHLLLGGDNLDFAISRRVEEKLSATLTLSQRYALRRSCCAAKEKLLGDDTLQSVPVTVLGSGSAVIARSQSVDLSRNEVLTLLTDGFLPVTPRDELPRQVRSKGLRELGLPFATDPAITRHLAAFLTEASGNLQQSPVKVAQPDAVLFNGGFCTPAIVRQRIIEVIGRWFSNGSGYWRPEILEANAMESAVAVGAAHYALLRRCSGTRVRVGNPRTYYVGLNSSEELTAVCILPAGVEAGTTFKLHDHDFSLLANRPVSFSLFSSRTQHTAHGEVVTLNRSAVHRHAPLVSMLRFGKKLREKTLKVRLSATFTEIGTLELWCESLETAHRWRLQFELRAEEDSSPPGPKRDAVAANTISDSSVLRGEDLIAQCLGGKSVLPEELMSKLESELGSKRDHWPLATLRHFCDVLLKFSDGRKLSPEHENRWWYLLGFCLRPGFGAPEDARRIAMISATSLAVALTSNSLQTRTSIAATLRRVAGGLNASRQQALYRELMDSDEHRRAVRRNRQLEFEHWRLLASLEHLPTHSRIALGSAVLERVRKEEGSPIWLWCMGRIGARIPLYGPVHSVVPHETAAKWMNQLLDLPLTPQMTFAITSIGRRTDDSRRDLDEELRRKASLQLSMAGVTEDEIKPLLEFVAPDHRDADRSFGESLPTELPLISSSTCLLSLSALHEVVPSKTV